MNKRLLASLLLSATFLGAACGGGGEPADPASEPPAVATEASPIAAATSSPASGATAGNVDSERFAFGATPGKPVVYWIHTDW